MQEPFKLLQKMGVLRARAWCSKEKSFEKSDEKRFSIYDF